MSISLVEVAGANFRTDYDSDKRLCCINRVRDSLFESRVVAGGHEQLVPHEVQDKELAVV